MRLQIYELRKHGDHPPPRGERGQAGGDAVAEAPPPPPPADDRAAARVWPPRPRSSRCSARTARTLGVAGVNESTGDYVRDMRFQLKSDRYKRGVRVYVIMARGAKHLLLRPHATLVKYIERNPFVIAWAAFIYPQRRVGAGASFASSFARRRLRVARLGSGVSGMACDLSETESFSPVDDKLACRRNTTACVAIRDVSIKRRTVRAARVHARRSRMTCRFVAISYAVISGARVVAQHCDEHAALRYSCGMSPRRHQSSWPKRLLSLFFLS